MDDHTKIAAEAESKNVIVEEVVQPRGEAKFDSMSNSGALKEAIKIHTAPKEEANTPEKLASAPTNKEVQAAVEADIDPPPGFNREGVEAWKKGDIKGIQKEFKRLRDGGIQEISRANGEADRARLAERKAREEAKSSQDIDIIAKPFIDAAIARGQTRAQAISNVFGLVSALQKADPDTAKAELKNIGIDLDKAKGQTVVSNPALEAKIDALQKRQDDLEKEKETREYNQLAQTFDSVFKNLSALKTRTGEPVFPDLLDTSEEGNEFFRRIGSRTKDPYFRNKVLSRFPDADFTVLVREAYKAEMGRISGEPVQASSNKQQIDKSRRAAASTPGRIVTRNEHSNLIGKLGNKEAIRAARAYHREH